MCVILVLFPVFFFDLCWIKREENELNEVPNWMNHGSIAGNVCQEFLEFTRADSYNSWFEVNDKCKSIATSDAVLYKTIE